MNTGVFIYGFSGRSSRDDEKLLSRRDSQRCEIRFPSIFRDRLVTDETPMDKKRGRGGSSRESSRKKFVFLSGGKVGAIERIGAIVGSDSYFFVFSLFSRNIYLSNLLDRHPLEFMHDYNVETWYLANTKLAYENLLTVFFEIFF